MNYNELKSSVRAVIKENGNEEITGDLLQDVLIAIINTLGLGYQYAGVGTTATDPGVPDARVMYLCTAAGTYTNFGTQFILDGSKIAICTYDQTWNVDLLDIPTSAELSKYLQIADLATGTGDSEVTSMTQKAITEALLGGLKIADLATGTGDSEVTSMTQKAITEALNGVETDVSLLLTKAGIAEGIADTISAGTAQEFLQRQSGGDGVNCIKRIKGKTIAWNQLFDKSLLYSSQTYNGVTATGNTDTGEISFSGTAIGNEQFNLTAASQVKMVAGHKYLLRGATTNTPALRLADQTAVFDTGNGLIWTCNASNLAVILSCAIVNGRAYSGTIKVKVVDLTLMFGSGNEPSTVAEFEALYPLLYYAYNAGVLKSNDAAALLTDGFNQWDEVWEAGGLRLADGEEYPATDRICSKNYICVFPSTKYYTKGLLGNLCFYDANKQYISGISLAGNAEHTTPENCYYLRFETTGAYGTTYNNDICVNLSWSGYRNGEYEPYWKRVLALRLSELTGVPEGGTEADRVTIFPNGAGGAGSAFDSIFVENGVTKARGTMALKIDLGGLSSWGYGEYGGVNYFQCPVSGLKAAAPTSVANLICTRYTPRAAATSTGSGNGIATLDLGGTTYIRIFDSSMSSADVVDGVIAKLSGVELLAEATTPIVYTDLQYADGTPFTMPATILVDNGGTERIQAPEGATTPSAPFCCDSNYSISIANLVKKLSEQ